MRFASLGSGSKGNATIIESGKTRILLDCGFSVVETERRLAKLDHSTLDSLSAILVTHEHSDHVSGVGRLSRKYNLPVYATAGTYQSCKDNDFSTILYINPDKPFEIDDLHVQPFPVPHDAREPCQFVFSDGAAKLGILTDVGSETPHIIETLHALDALMLECNYDEAMLMQGSYPYKLKMRVAGNYGHLDNRQSSALLKKLDQSKLKHLVGMHLSEKNNRIEYANSALCEALGCEQDWLLIASQSDGFGWREI
ncbi:MAG TPA: MBL fold metallo-hydrolase [Leucothrix mucor]|nr:MBL fold metallo-hydrolase [Leucothrix mucor]